LYPYIHNYPPFLKKRQFHFRKSKTPYAVDYIDSCPKVEQTPM
jgi:hypothetical protein